MDYGLGWKIEEIALCQCLHVGLIPLVKRLLQLAQVRLQFVGENEFLEVFVTECDLGIVDLLGDLLFALLQALIRFGRK